jgi:DNA-directed RNA polymerase subunit RPC12/RpoP
MTPKERQRNARLLRIYGIDLQQYLCLLLQQGGCCAICQRDYTEFKTNLAVDHDHFTGEVRGLLCSHCNHRLVGRHRDPELLRRIADYVEQGTGWFVPKKKKAIKRKPKRG